MKNCEIITPSYLDLFCWLSLSSGWPINFLNIVIKLKSTFITEE